jgi:signal transduction histidine kinase
MTQAITSSHGREAAAINNRYDQPLRESIDKMLQLRAAVGANGFALLMMYALRADRRMMWQVALVCATFAVFAAVLSRRVLGMMDRRLANIGFFIGNTIYVLALMYVSRFARPVGFMVPLVVLIYDGFGEGETRPFVYAMLAIFTVAPLACGVPAAVVLPPIGAGMLVQWFSEGRALTLRLALADRRSQAELLRQAHRRSREVNDLLLTRNTELAANSDALRSARDRAAHAEKLAAIGRLAAGVAHEINNPIGVILGFAQGLERRIEASSNLNAAVTAIVREARRCKSLIQELLTFSRTSTPTWESVDLNVLLDGTMQLLTARARAQATRVFLHVDASLPMVVASRIGLQQVIVNLANNALDAVADKGEVSIRCERASEDVVRIEVADTGPGIPSEILSRIFEPFFTTKDAGKGTGLGLSLVHDIIDQHGGRIDVESRLGAGTTMIVTLPVRLDAAAASKPASSDLPVGGQPS